MRNLRKHFIKKPESPNWANKAEEHNEGLKDYIYAAQIGNRSQLCNADILWGPMAQNGLWFFPKRGSIKEVAFLHSLPSIFTKLWACTCG